MSSVTNRSTTYRNFDLKIERVNVQAVPQNVAENLGQQKYLSRLLRILADRFDEDGLRTLCFDLGVDYDDLPRTGKENKARELLLHLKRHGQMGRMVEVGRQHRPDVLWEGYSLKVTSTPWHDTEPEILDLPLQQMNAWVTRVKTGQADRHTSRALGKALFEALFPRPIRNMWERSQQFIDAEATLRLRLDVSPAELATLPWEVIYDDYFLAMTQQRPIIRHMDGGPVPHPSTCPALNVLIAVSTPRTRPETAVAERTAILIRDKLTPLTSTGLIGRLDLLFATTFQELEDRLQQGYHSLHLIGSGVHQRGASSLVFAKQNGGAKLVHQDTLNALVRETSLQLLALNSVAASTADPVDPILHLAQTNFTAGVPAVVALPALAGEVMAGFAHQFYGALLEGHPLEFCILRGRKVIMDHTGPEGGEWMVPVLFSNVPDGQLWLPPTPPDESMPEPLAASSPATAAPPKIRHNLTNPDYAHFINREKALQRIIALLDPPSRASLVNITGIGGIGRSALAREVAYRYLDLAQEHPQDARAFHGIIWASAQRHRFTSQGTLKMRQQVTWSLDDLHLTIASALKKQAVMQARPEERAAIVQDLLREGRYLLILDDADEMQDPRLDDFLRQLPVPSKAIITSNVSLGLPGAEVRLSSLGTEAAVQLLMQDAQTNQVEAVAQAGKAELQKLATQADGIPLVLRWTVAQLADSGQPLSWAIDHLAQAVHQPLAEFCLRRSLQILTPPQRRLLLAFALYPQPTTAEAAAEAAGVHGGERDPALTRLVQLRLLQPMSAFGRFHIMNLTRQYILTELEADQSFKAEAIDRTVEYAYRFARANAQPGNWSGFDRLEAEVGNLLWAVNQAYRLGKWQRVADFRQELGDFLYLRGYWNEAIQVGQRAFEATDWLGDAKGRAWCALYPLARVHYHQGNYEEARYWSRRSLVLFQRQQEDYGAAAAERYLGQVMQATGEFDQAHDLFTDGLAKARRFNTTPSDFNMQGNLLAALAGLAQARGAHAKAQRRYEEALVFYRKTDNQLGIATTLYQLGNIAMEQDQYDKADRLFQESLQTLQGSGWVEREAKIVFSQALLAEEQGDLVQAQEKLQQTRQRFQALSSADLARVDATLTRVSAALTYEQRQQGKNR